MGAHIHWINELWIWLNFPIDFHLEVNTMNWRRRRRRSSNRVETCKWCDMVNGTRTWFCRNRSRKKKLYFGFLLSELSVYKCQTTFFSLFFFIRSSAHTFFFLSNSGCILTFISFVLFVTCICVKSKITKLSRLHCESGKLLVYRLPCDLVLSYAKHFSDQFNEKLWV